MEEGYVGEEEEETGEEEAVCGLCMVLEEVLQHQLPARPARA